jgi:MoaA/NifB/PqqE/SkfB family radical SAM enzyme
MLKLNQIEQLQIELTTRCNARCPMCMRNYHGMEYNGGYPEIELSLANIKQILQPKFLQQIKRVLFNGNLGDFGLARESQEIVAYLIDSGVPNIDISTNGSMRTPAWWARLAHPAVTVGFALDGLEDTHHLHRQDTDWHRIIANARAFIAAGGRAVWRWIPFDHNRHQEQACRNLAKELGFVKFENIGHGRDRSPAFTRDGKYSHLIGAPYKPGDVTNPPKIDQLLTTHLTWFSPATVRNKNDTPDLKITCHHKRVGELYIAADGSVSPCCYLGFYPQTMHHPGNEQLKPIARQNNALDYSLEQCVAWFDRVEESWQQESIAAGRMYICVNTCGSQ